MKLTVIGASKGTGARVAERAAADGHDVTALSRSGTALPTVTTQAGDALDREAVRRAIRGADAVVVTLGAPARDTTGLRARATAVLVEAMGVEGVRRLLIQSSLGVGDSAPLLPWFTKRVVVPLYLKRAFADHLEQEREARSSGLDWTIVRPGYLTNDPLGNYISGFTSADPTITSKVSRADVADFFVRSLDRPDLWGKAVALSRVRS
jgi:kynurenine 3-monooxygenase